MLSALCWVPRGAAKAVPDRVQPSEEELRAMQAGAERTGARRASMMLSCSAELLSACVGQALLEKCPAPFGHRNSAARAVPHFERYGCPYTREACILSKR